MEQRFSLEAAGKLFGITANAMRARAKKSPEKYRIERDNSGKIWLWIDPERLPDPKAVKAKVEGSKSDNLKASIDALMERSEAVAELRERLSSEIARADAAERARDQAEADRDRWQAMAERLTDRPRRSWWPWSR